jgi:hypothetical protein
MTSTMVGNANGQTARCLYLNKEQVECQSMQDVGVISFLMHCAFILAAERHQKRMTRLTLRVVLPKVDKRHVVLKTDGILFSLDTLTSFLAVTYDFNTRPGPHSR